MNIEMIKGMYDVDGNDVDITKELYEIDIDCQWCCSCCGSEDFVDIIEDDDGDFDMKIVNYVCDYCKSELEEHHIEDEEAEDGYTYLYTYVIEDNGLGIRLGYLRDQQINEILND